jgi:GWxTD domain-containing protein
MNTKNGIAVFIIAFFLNAIIFAQGGPNFQVGEVGLPHFNTGLFATFSADSGAPLARAYVQIPNDNLTFVKTDSGFQAEVQIELYLTKEGQDFVFNRTISRKVLVTDYNETNSKDKLNTLYTEVEVDSGQYEALVTVSDRNSNKQFSQKKTLSVSYAHDENKKLGLSDILFFSQCEKDKDGNISRFEPELTNNFSGMGKFVYAYFNSFSFGDQDSMLVQYAVKDNRGVVIQQNKYILKRNSGLMEHFIRLNRYYFGRNTYTLEVSANIGNQWITKLNSFGFFWKYVPNTQQDLDLAIEYLRYIAPGDSIKHYRDKSFEEKQQFFRRFWRQNDPNPDTEENELMIEYYRRVNLANENFSATGVRGWLTDRGRIYIKFGQPDEIDRHPFEASTYPYVVWHYYSVRKTFVFIDRSGFGDYELHPNYYYVEYE